MVSVIIVSWNTRDLLRECLLSLRLQADEVGGSIWVVDNNSQDGSADVVEAEFPDVHLARNDANVGFARACNQVTPLSTEPYVLFFNPDAVLDDGGLRVLVDVMERNPELGALMPRLLDADGNPTHYVGRAPRLLAARLRIARELAWRFGGSPAVRRLWERTSAAYRGASAAQGLYERPKLEGAALMVRRKALDEVGLFDPGFFCGYEETDLTLRLRAAGWGLAVTADASVRHHDQQSRLQWKTRPWEIADGCYFFRKHQGLVGLRRHVAAEMKRLKFHQAAGEDVEALRLEYARVLAALERSPRHPGYGAWQPV
jgi:GT2 family glycosyltransferase